MTDFNLSPQNAHSNARILLKDDFYWSPIEETAPFGNEEGADAFTGFEEWRRTNKEFTPIAYYHRLVAEWHYPPFEWNEMDPKKIKEYIAANRIGNMMLIGLDSALIGIGFGQFVLEGKIDEGLKVAVKAAIERQLLPVLLDEYDEPYRTTRSEQLNKMLNVLDYMNSKLRIA